MTKEEEIIQFRKQIEESYKNAKCPCTDFGDILYYEFHDQPVNPRMRCKTINKGFKTGLTFKEIAQKWNISMSFMGDLILDHCKKLDGIYD